MNLQVVFRKKTGKGANRQLQLNGRVPAVLYGGKENTNLTVSHSAISALFLGTGGKTQILDLELEGKGIKKAIIQDYQYSRIAKKFIHIDFLEVSASTIVNLDIPVRTIGDSIVSKMGGVVQVIRHEIPITCQAKDIPASIEIDISKLNFGDSIHILDVTYPKGVKPVATGRNFTIVSTSTITEEAQQEAETPEEEQVQTPEQEQEQVENKK